MSITKQNIAWVSWSLDIDCPKCGESIDLSDQDDDRIFSIAIFSNKWNDLKGADCYCDKCLHEFVVDGIEY